MTRRTRDLIRIGHLVGAALLGTYVYSPWSADPTFSAVVKWLVVPGLSTSGLLLWKGHLLRRRRRGAHIEGGAQ